MNNSPIGVFDSGMGGLTCVKELNRLMPNEDIIYFGDTARIPYGTRSKETVLNYARQDTEFIRKQGVKMIIAACGTVSSVIGRNKDFVTDIPFTGVLFPTVQAACSKTLNNKIGVIGTAATIKSGAYGKVIRTLNPDIKVYGSSCTLFVPLVESGFTSADDPITKLAVEKYLAPIKAEGVDTLILGCTHYPILREAIANFMGDGVSLISSGYEAANFANVLLTKEKLLSDRTRAGKNTFFVSDSTELFTQNANLYLDGDVAGDVHKVPIEELISL